MDPQKARRLLTQTLCANNMSNQIQSYTLGPLEIQGPTASEKRCSIFVDLAELLNMEYTSDAVEKLKSEWKELGKKGKLDIEAESGYVSILTSKSAIVDLALLINDISSQRRELDKKMSVKLEKLLKAGISQNLLLGKSAIFSTFSSMTEALRMAKS